MAEEVGFYFRSAISVLVVIFGFDDKSIRLLVQERKNEPQKGCWALPGGMAYPNESIEDKVSQIVAQATGISQFYIKQIRAFADTSRHPLGRVIAIGYYAFVDIRKYKPNAQQVQDQQWVDVRQVPQLAFDHNEITAAAHRRLIAKMSTQLTGFELLPDEFTLTQLQNLYECALGHTLDKRNFRRKALSHKVIVDLNKPLQPYDGSGKAPMLYKLDRAKYQAMKNDGYRFELF